VAEGCYRALSMIAPPSGLRLYPVMNWESLLARNNITVNNVLPIADTWGAEKKDIPPPTNALARFGSPEDDIAPVVLFL
ncbi:hypothetical protein ACC675_38040, partial [Rhizobium ruizarguesonis]